MKKNWPWIVGGLAVGTLAVMYYYGKKVAESGPVVSGLYEDVMMSRFRFGRARPVGYMEVNRIRPAIDAAMKVRRYN
jgi:hypothetical protein